MSNNQVTERLSLTGRRWTEPAKAPPPLEVDLPEPLPAILAQRGQTVETIGEFLSPTYPASLLDPFLLRGMAGGVQEVHRTLKAGDRIGIHGDYDADGLTATALMADLLHRLGQSPELIVPDRYQDGYGISSGTTARVRESGVKLLITVDCGISNAREIAELRQDGVRVIITDHHQPPTTLPDAEAVINPQLPDDSYPNKNLAGVGVAFKLAQAVLATSELGEPEREKTEKWLLDLVAIGTVADLMPLRGENRALVNYGLAVLRHGRRPGLAALAEVAGVALPEATAQTIGYRLAPRLNAAGRMHSPMAALETLTASDEATARDGAVRLAEANTARQSATTEAVEAVLESVGEPGADQRIIMAEGPWKSGIVGLVAGKLAGRYHRPALVIEVTGDEARGSARSIPGFDITAAIRSQAELLTTYGGHAAAGGFSLPAANLPAFREGLEAYAATRLSTADLVPELMIDARLTPAQVTPDLVAGLTRLEPCGNGNPAPLFLVSGRLTAARTVGQDATHLRLDLELPGGRRLAAIGFGLGELQSDLAAGQSVELAGRPVINRFNGSEQVEWQVEDARTG